MWGKICIFALRLQMKEMMKNKTIFKAMMRRMAACLAVVALVACSDGLVADYELTVPKDAGLVVAVDLEDVVEGSGFTDSAFGKGMIAAAVNSLGGGGQTGLKAVINDPSLTGIDFDAPAYVFRRSNVTGLAMKVDDESLTEAFISDGTNSGLFSKVEKHDGLSWTTLLDDICVVWSDNTLLAVSSDGSSRQALEKLALSYMKQDEQDAFVTTDKYKKMTAFDDDEDIIIYADASLMPELMAELTKELGLPAAGSTGLELVAAADLDDGEIEINARLSSNDKKIQASLDEYQHAMKPISGTYADMIPGGCSAWMCIGMDGEKMLKLLKRMPAVKQFLIGANMGVDADKMIRTIDGDVLMMTDDRVNNDSLGTDHLRLYAQLKNTDFMADVDYWMKSAKDYGISLVRTGNNEYRLSPDCEADLYWAVKSNELYFGSCAYAPLHPNAGTNLPKDYFNGKTVAGRVDLTGLTPVLRYADVSVDTKGCATIRIRMANIDSILDNLLMR